jgi:Molecular chaperone (small heat shock protein)
MSFITSLIPAFASSPVARRRQQPVTVPADEPVVAPHYEITETPEAYGLVVDLPGVAKDGLDLSVDHEQIRVLGRRAWRKPEGWTTLHRESREASFELVLEHGRAIDVDKVHAELRDGVLRVSLPKAEALKPRKISVA